VFRGFSQYHALHVASEIRAVSKFSCHFWVSEEKLLDWKVSSHKVYRPSHDYSIEKWWYCQLQSVDISNRPESRPCKELKEVNKWIWENIVKNQ
jgi:hypothetical protein